MDGASPVIPVPRPAAGRRWRPTSRPPIARWPATPLNTCRPSSPRSARRRTCCSSASWRRRSTASRRCVPVSDCSGSAALMAPTGWNRPVRPPWKPTSDPGATSSAGSSPAARRRSHPTDWASPPTCADPPTTGTEQGPESMKHPTHEALRRLRLYGMARGLEDLERQPERSQLTFDDQLALLVEREMAERANTALASRLKRARLRQTACLEDLDWRTPRGLDRTLVRDLASCRWVREHQPLLVTGPTGIGKTFVACALGNQAAREGYGVFYTRLTRLLDDLATARLDGSLARVLRRLARLEVLIIDDWAMTELTAAQRLDLMEVIDDRHDRAATVLATQIPVANWHRSIGDATYAGAILDRVVHRALRIELTGESMRRVRAADKASAAQSSSGPLARP